MEEEDKLFSKKELNEKCPLCGSGPIYKGIVSFGFKVGGNSNKYPDANIEAWHCENCKKCFNVLKEDC